MVCSKPSLVCSKVCVCVCVCVSSSNVCLTKPQAEQSTPFPPRSAICPNKRNRGGQVHVTQYKGGCVPSRLGSIPRVEYLWHEIDLHWSSPPVGEPHVPCSCRRRQRVLGALVNVPIRVLVLHSSVHSHGSHPVFIPVITLTLIRLSLLFDS